MTGPLASISPGLQTPTSQPIDEATLQAAIAAYFATFPPQDRATNMVFAEMSSQFSTSSTSYVDTGLATTITPSSVESKIFVQAFTPVASGAGWLVNLRLQRNGTTIGAANNGILGGDEAYCALNGRINGSNDHARYVSHYRKDLLDAPGTIEPLTYSIQMRVTGGATAYLNRWALNADAGGTSTLTLLEIV